MKIYEKWANLNDFAKHIKKPVRNLSPKKFNFLFYWNWAKKKMGGNWQNYPDRLASADN